jgi:protein SCO1/2
MAAALPVSARDGLMPKPGERRNANPDVGIDDKVGQMVPTDLVFRDENGQAITIGECIGGKPTILVLAYYRCPMNCTDVLNGLVDALRAMPSEMSVGGAFNVVTVSFDPKEQPELARLKKQSYLEAYGRPGAETGWRFLTGAKEPIAQLTDAVGFRYAYDKVYKEYDHPTGVVVLTPEGKIARYFYGVDYGSEYRVPGGTTTLRLTLVEASDGKVGSLLDKLILTCYRFDYLEKEYSLNILLAVRVGGILTVLLLAGGVTFFVMRERRRNFAKANSPVTDESAAPAGEELK